MNDLRKAAEMALEALEDIFGKEKKDVGAINALRQALNVDAVNMTPDRVDETAKGEHESFGYLRREPFGYFRYDLRLAAWVQNQGGIPFYTAPPKKEWVGLTDEEIQAERHKLDTTAGWTYDHFARAIEAKLKEKNT